MRDDFTQVIKRILAERAGFTCSNRECRRNQLGPAPGDDAKSVNLGKAAHICAAASGGPRYDGNQTTEQRKSISNAIFLCGACSDLIDKNDGRGHPVDLLRAWKEEHEKWVSDQLNKGALDAATFEGVIWQEVASTVGVVGRAQTVNIVQSGISYADARDIALDVYKANYLQLSEKAAAIARSRAEELTDTFLADLQQRNPDGIASMESVGMQHAIYTAQKEFARTGDKDLEGLLVDILVDRAATQERTIKQIVLDEALSVAPKLTVEQLDALTLNFLISRTKLANVSSLESFLSQIDNYYVPFVDVISNDTSCYEHLVYAGCGSISLIGGLRPVAELFRLNYPGLFSMGFDQGEWDMHFLNEPEIARWAVTTSLHNPAKLQINAVDESVLVGLSEQHGASSEELTKLKALLSGTCMPENDVKEYILRERPGLQKLFDAWQGTALGKLTLTTVGIAVAHANFRRRTGIQLDLDIWVK